MARTKEQNEALKKARLDKIRSAALHLFAGRGLAATKISDIARATQMSQGLVYHYYSSKDDIFTDLIRNAFETLNQACRTLLSDEAPPHEKISMALQALIQGLKDHPDTAQTHLLIATATASDAIPAPAKEVIARENTYPYAVIEEIIRQGQALGTVKQDDPGALATLFWTSVLGLAIHRSSHGDRAQFPDIAILTRLFLVEDPT